MMGQNSATGALTSLDAALTALLDGLAPVAPIVLPLDKALGRIAAQMPPLAHAHPARSIATMDGWALRALDISGASAYSPVPLAVPPAWVETGDVMPEDSDCVVEADLLDCSSPVIQALAEAVPGQGVRRAGEDLSAGRPPVAVGRKLSAADLLIARYAGISEVAVRAPRLRVIDVAAKDGCDFTARFIVESARASGAIVGDIEAVARDASAVAHVLGCPDRDSCDLTILIGGTGAGRADATAEALGAYGTLIAHQIALQPGRTTAIGRLGGSPVVALPGRPDHALGAFLALVTPVLDRLSGRSERRPIVLPLDRKIASVVGLAEIVLLKQERDAWTPLAVGDFSLDAIGLADAWLAIPGGNEGYAAGTAIGAFPLRDLN